MNEGEFGKVTYPLNCTAKVLGLRNSRIGELVEFASGVTGVVMNLYEKESDIALIGKNASVS